MVSGPVNAADAGESGAIQAAAPGRDLPRSLLYTTSARIGGTGLDVSALEGIRASADAGFLARAIGFANQQNDVPASRIRSLHRHPVRLLSALGSRRYYGAKKHCVDRVGRREIRSGRYDFLHTWSGDCLQSLIAARQRRIPSVVDIPTWHRNKGRNKPFLTKSEREASKLRGTAGWLHRLVVSRQEILMEYELATLLFMPSQRSAETFLAAGIPSWRLHYTGRGVDPDRYRPGPPPDRFRAVFAGALIRRKGVHHLITAWRKLGFRDAELVLVGTPHPEIHPDLRDCEKAGITVTGFVRNPEDYLSQATVFVFPSECEGFAKVTLEAAACGLPLIATRESGDAIVDGETGRLIPPDDPDAIAGALEEARSSPHRYAAMGRNARALVESRYTWQHFRERILDGYRKAMRLVD